MVYDNGSMFTWLVAFKTDIHPSGSPDEPKSIPNLYHAYHNNMHPASMVAMPSSFNHNILAKPVPMRRLSEKRMSHARVTLGDSNAMEPDQGRLHVSMVNEGLLFLNFNS